MAKVIFTEELAHLIKSLRIENHISAKDLATHIDKSTSYVTKLEKCEIQSVKEDALLSILKFVLGNKENPDEIIESVFRTLSYKYSTDEIENLVWFYNFDTVIRNIPVPDAYCVDINNLLSEKNISVDYLVSRINNNEFIPDKSVCSVKKRPVNQWFECKIDGVSKTFIIMQVDVNDIKSILNGSTTVANYVTLLAIALYVIKIQIYESLDVIDFAIQEDIKKQATEFLASHKVLTLTEKQRRIETARTQAEREMQLSTYDIENMNLISKLNQNLKVYSDYDIKMANKHIDLFTKNLMWDAPFTMRVAALDFTSLEPCSFRVKKLILTEVEQIIQKYLECSPADRSIEEY